MTLRLLGLPGTTILAWVGIASASLAQPRIVNLGTLPGGHVPTHGQAISDDGRIVAGHGSSSVESYRIFRWTESRGMEQLFDLPEDYYAYCQGLSADGSAFCGYVNVTVFIQRPFRWSERDGLEDLGSLYEQRNAAAYGISGDGTTVVGRSETAPHHGSRAFRWRRETGMEDLGAIGSFSYAYGTNRDGSVVTGETGTAFEPRAFRWSQSAGMVTLPLLPNGTAASASAISADGESIVGTCKLNGSFHRAFRWTPSEGTRDLGVPEGARDAYGLAISDDGMVAAGYCYYQGPGFVNRACLWSEGTGMVDLNEYLPTVGVDLTGWVLTHARALSADGSAITGSGTFEGRQVAWLVTGLFAPVLEISVTGQCPGRQTLTWRNATSGSRLGILFAMSQGGYVIPGGRCAGTVLGLADNRLGLVDIRPAGDGSGSASANVGDSVCGGFVQVVELPSCRTSNVVPVAP